MLRFLEDDDPHFVANNLLFPVPTNTKLLSPVPYLQEMPSRFVIKASLQAYKLFATFTQHEFNRRYLNDGNVDQAVKSQHRNATEFVFKVMATKSKDNQKVMAKAAPKHQYEQQRNLACIKYRPKFVDDFTRKFLGSQKFANYRQICGTKEAMASAIDGELCILNIRNYLLILMLSLCGGH
jgi:hypothetical protein